jgi:hypothetical protein
MIRYQKLSILLLLIFVSAMFSSCAVMFGGSKFRGTIIAKDHSEAKIFVDGKEVGKGKSVGLYPRNKPITIDLQQEGCAPKSQTFKHAFRGGTFTLSILSFGVVGLIVDLSSGAAFKPDHVVHPEIQRVNTKDFTFTVDYSGCPTGVAQH